MVCKTFCLFSCDYRELLSTDIETYFRSDGKDKESAFSDKLAVIGFGKTCEIRCGGRHNHTGLPLDYRLSGEGQRLKFFD